MTLNDFQLTAWLHSPWQLPLVHSPPLTSFSHPLPPSLSLWGSTLALLGARPGPGVRIALCGDKHNKCRRHHFSLRRHLWGSFVTFSDPHATPCVQTCCGPWSRRRHRQPRCAAPRERGNIWHFSFLGKFYFTPYMPFSGFFVSPQNEHSCLICSTIGRTGDTS